MSNVDNNLTENAPLNNNQDEDLNLFPASDAHTEPEEEISMLEEDTNDKNISKTTNTLE